VFVPNPAGVTLPVEVGSSTIDAVYVGGTGTALLTFRYTVQPGDEDRDGILLTGSLSAPAGAIKDATGANAELTYSPPDTSAIFVDAVNPTLTATVAGPANGKYGVGSQLSFTATFSEPMLVSGAPRIALTIGNVTRYAVYTAGSETRVLVFEYQVQPGDSDLNGIVVANAITLSGGSITDLAGNTGGLTFSPLSTGGVVVDAVPPTITKIMVPTTTPNGSYRLGRQIPIEAIVSRAVVSGSKVEVTLDTGATVVLAAPVTGTLLQGTYTVGAGENSADLTVTTLADVSIVDSVGNRLGSTVVPTGTNNIAGSRAITIDTITPTAPTIVAVTDNVTPVQGTISSGGATNDNTPTVSGTAEPFSVVTLKAGSATVGSATADVGGVWSITTLPLAEGITSLTASAVDAAGNASPSSNAHPVMIDTKSPAAPTFGAVVGTLLSGKAEAGAIVNILRNDAGVGTAIAAANGDWACTLSLVDGVYTLTATATDAAGNVSQPTQPTSVTIDTAPPARPDITQVMDDVVLNTGSISAGGLTNDPSPTISGTAKPGTVVTLRSNSTVLGTATSSALGIWTITLGPLTDGPYALEATAKDAAENTSPPSVIHSITVDTRAPLPPTISSISDDLAPVKGPIAADVATNDSTPTVSGDAEPGSSVTLKSGSSVIGTATADASGKWVLTLAPLSEGLHSLTATAADAAGNASGPSMESRILVDTLAPTPPTITGALDNTSPVTGTIASGRSTNDTTPTLNGMAESGTLVTLRRGSTVLGTVNADAAGKWSYISVPLPDALYTITATATDAAGNESTASGSYNLVIDTVAPAAPIITSVDDDTDPQMGSVLAGAATNDVTPTVSGTAEPGAIVTLRSSAVIVGTSTADPTGKWSITTSSLANGTRSLTATASDTAGNESGESIPFAILVDTIKPAAPAITTVFDDVAPAVGPVANSGATNDTTPTVSGTAEAGAVVTLRSGATVIGTATADANGIWSITSTTLLDGSQSLTATATDAAGNTGISSTARVVVVDTVAPTTPTITSIVSDVPSSTGIVGNNGQTNDNQLLVSGIAEPNSRVTFWMNYGTVRGAMIVTTANANGQWAVTTAALPDGMQTFSAITRDAASNKSPLSEIQSVIVDTVAPRISAVTSTAANGTYSTGQPIAIQVAFTEPVQATGSPMLLLNTSPARFATFTGSSGGTLHFVYTPATGDVSLRLDYASISALSLNGGTIRDAAGNAASTALAAPGSVGSLRESRTIVIDAAIKAVAGGLSSSAASPAVVASRMTSIPITFSTPVTGVTLSTIKLFFEERSVSLTGATITGSGKDYVLKIPGLTTSLRGTYRLRIGGGASGIKDGSVAMAAASTWYWKRV